MFQQIEGLHIAEYVTSLGNEVTFTLIDESFVDSSSKKLQIGALRYNGGFGTSTSPEERREIREKLNEWMTYIRFVFLRQLKPSCVYLKPAHEHAVRLWDGYGFVLAEDGYMYL